MEFKISEKSQRNFEQLCKDIGAKEYMSPTDLAEYEENERLLSKEKKKQKPKMLQKLKVDLSLHLNIHSTTNNYYGL